MKATLNDLLNAKGVSEPLREAVKVLQRENAELREALEHPSYEEENRLRAEVDRMRAKIEHMEKQEPVEWQSRSRPSWGDHQWSEWASCSTGYAEDITKSPELHDWQYEARALYALPGAAPKPEE